MYIPRNGHCYDIKEWIGGEKEGGGGVLYNTTQPSVLLKHELWISYKTWLVDSVDVTIRHDSYATHLSIYNTDVQSPKEGRMFPSIVHWLIHLHYPT